MTPPGTARTDSATDGAADNAPDNDTRTRPTTTTAVVGADRPVMLAGLETVFGDAGPGDTGPDEVDPDEVRDLRIAASCTVGDLVRTVEAHAPDLLVVALHDHGTDPFQAIATAHALAADLRILALIDAVTVVDLREAIVAGVDSVLLTTASVTQIREAATATARGERIVSPDIAMNLAGTWRSDDDDMVAGLTPRELEVLEVVAEGRTNKEVAAELDLSARTVKTHVQNLLAKLDAPDRTGAVATGFRLGLIK